ncbi:MAG: hypothetical protein WD795_00880 [Woeseia sp.]
MNASSRCNKIAKDTRKKFDSNRSRGENRPGAKTLLPALMALGGGAIFAGPAFALELGDIQVHSTLGQPLRASVAIALHANEQIHDYCIYLKPGIAANGLPSIGNAAVSVSDGAIRLTGHTAIKEPLVTLQLTVDCPYTAHLRREYWLFVDPASPSQQADEPVAASRSALPARTESRDRPAAIRAVTRVPIAASASYRVQPGDTLSGIAARISGRTVGIWQAVDALFAANADAFIDGDRNLLRSGALLAIPDAILAGQSAGNVVSPAAEPAVANMANMAEPVARAYSAYIPGSNTTSPAPVTAAQEANHGTVPAEVRPDASAPSQARTAAPQPGDVSLGSDSPFVSPIDAGGEVVASRPFAVPTETIPATDIENAVSPRSMPGVRSTEGATRDSWSWLAWLGGSGIALILGLLLFGRRLKERLGPESDAADTFGRRRTDPVENDDTDVAPVLGLPSQGAVPVARRVSLDADLDDGSGFQYGGDIDIAQDFGFSDSGKFKNGLDMDFSSAADDDTNGRTTDIIVPRRTAEPTILVSETPPSHDDTGEYDLSMIVDATRQSLDNSDATTKDLRAIQVNAADDDTVSEEYTLSKEVDYKVLEQDYEDELTATQALNAEISKAARALSRQMGKDEMGDTLTDTVNEEGPPLVPDDVFASGDDETILLPASGAELPGADDTAQMPVTAATSKLDDTANEEITISVPAAENDSTVEVDIESATIDTRKMRAS